MLFYFLLLCCPLAAWTAPWIGNQSPESIYLVCVAGIFFCAGLQIDRTAFSDTQRHLRAALAIQTGSFILMPLLALLLLWILFPRIGIPSSYTIGILFTAMLPVTTTSCGAFCQLAKVPPLDAVMNAIVGNMLGLAVLPFLVPLLLMNTDSDPYGAMRGAMTQVGLFVFVPLVLGYFLGLRSFFKGWNIRTVSQALLLWIIYRCYCKSFSILYGSDESGLYPLFFGMLIFHGLGNLISLAIGYFFHFDGDTRMVFLFTIPQKTIVLGLPLAAALANSGQNQALWLALVMPLLMYNNIQYLVGGTIAWINGRKAIYE
ncbi:MAG: bile acid:sodium symporter [Parachlamydiales bacterium]|jgi:predicted Na+-dependent transporter